MKEDIDKKNGQRKVEEEFLEEGGFVGLYFAGEALANIPVRNSIFEIMGKDNKGDANGGIGNF